MALKSISQCATDLDFQPRRPWPLALTAVAWRGQLISGFHHRGAVVDVFELQGSNLLDTIKACHPELGLAELARISGHLERIWPDLFVELREGLMSVYGLRWSQKLSETLARIRQTPMEFQNWVDDKKFGARDLSPISALSDLQSFFPFLKALPTVLLSKFEGARALEMGVELYLMERPLNDLLPAVDNGGLWLQRLEQWRRPQSALADQERSREVQQWPWPQQVQAHWQRFGDEAGLEIKIRTTSPGDLEKKLERLMSIPESWSCKN